MSLRLPTPEQMYETRVGPLEKPQSRAARRAKKTRAEKAVISVVRAACVRRDGNCRLCYSKFDDVVTRSALDLEGAGFPQWAHLHSHRRSKTRGQAPTQRHTTTTTVMLCEVHHDHYDGRRYPRLFITTLSRNGADGPLKFRGGAK